MPRTFRVALIGDYDSSVIAHQAIPEALRLAGLETAPAWVDTLSIRDAASDLDEFDGIWCVPASPYANMDGALDAIRFARESGRRFLGTCGGFQHAAIEFARNVCGLTEAGHAETHPEAVALVVAPLACSLVEESEELIQKEGSKVREAYCAERITEGYHCSYGLNPAYVDVLESHGLRATAHGVNGEVRAVELEGHPFFVATLFQHERRALRGEVSPLVVKFLDQSGGAI